MFLMAQILAVLVWLVVMPKFSSGPPGGAYHYRSGPRMAALSEKYAHPSPQTIATWEHELALLETYKLVHLGLKIAFVLAFDAIVIYFLRTRVGKNQTA
jgi:hypothetical protein